LKTIIFNININTDAIYFSVLSAQQLTATLYGHNDQISGYYNIIPNENYGVNIFEAFDNLYGNNVNNSNITKIIFLDNEEHIYTKFNESLTPASFLQFLRDFDFISNTDNINTISPKDEITKFETNKAINTIKTEKVKTKQAEKAEKVKTKQAVKVKTKQAEKAEKVKTKQAEKAEKVKTKQAEKAEIKKAKLAKQAELSNNNDESSPPFWYDDNFKIFRDFILKPEDFKDSITPKNLQNIFSSFKTAILSNIIGIPV